MEYGEHGVEIGMKIAYSAFTHSVGVVFGLYCHKEWSVNHRRCPKYTADSVVEIADKQSKADYPQHT